MISQELLNQLAIIDKKLIETFSLWEVENIFARNVKLTEEVWELSSEILKKFHSRNWKIFNQENMMLEFADVIFATLLLAKSLWVDVNEAINKKLNKINERWGI